MNPRSPAASATGPAPILLAYSDHRFEGVPSTDPLLLAESLRAFGGSLKDAPIWYLIRDDSTQGEALAMRASALKLGIEVYKAEAGLEPWPFATKALAAAKAEEEAEGRAELLAWFDRDSLVTGELSPLLLPPGKSLGYRPVNLRNIGSPANSPPDPFWTRAISLSGIDPEALGRTRAYIGGETLRFYIAAGLLVVRPEAGILRAWAEHCRRFVSDPVLSALARESPAGLIFLHQAALSLAAAALVPEESRFLLPDDLMYPLNLWSRDSPERRPARIDALRSLRYDTMLEDESWKKLPMSPSFAAWLQTMKGK